MNLFFLKKNIFRKKEELEMAEYMENQTTETNNGNYDETMHPLLDQDCQHYIEAAVKAQDKLFKSFHQHKKFLSHWYYCIQRRQNSHDALHFAFEYYKEGNKNIAERTRDLAKNFLENLRQIYNNKDKTVTQFVKNFPNDSRQLILTNDIDWTITGKEEYAIIADEFYFAWSVARLWQLLETRKQEHLIKDFLFLYKNKDLSFSEEYNPTNHSAIPEELCNALKEICPRDDDFFKRTKRFFNPEYLNSDEMVVYLKIACISAVFKKSPSETSRKPLDNIWLLARFYGIHFYSYDFIFGKKRGLSGRFLKQIETLQNPAILEAFDVSALEKKKQKTKKLGTIKWGQKLLGYPEILASIKDKTFLEKLREKSREIIQDKEQDPYAPIIDAWEKVKSKDSILDKIDFSNPKLASLLKKKPKLFNTLYLWIAFINETESFANEEDSEDDVKEDDVEYAGFAMAEFIASSRWYLEHEKNLSLITYSDVDLNVLAILVLVWAISKLFQAQKDNLKK